MYSIPGSLFVLVLLYSIILLIINLNSQFENQSQSILLQTSPSYYNTNPIEDNETLLAKHKYNFTDPDLAYYVLSEFDVFKPVDESYFEGRSGDRSFYDIPFLGLTLNDYYCEEHREYFVNNSESLFHNMNILTEGLANRSFVRSKVVPHVAVDIQPEVIAHYKNKRKFDIKPAVNAFFVGSLMYIFQHVGLHFSCLTQISNHIPGNFALSRKSMAAEATKEYLDKYNDRPHCVSNDNYFSRSWMLFNKEECQDFFRILDSPEYAQAKKERHIVYVSKIGFASHRGMGVDPVNEKEEAILRANYSNGALCGEITKDLMIQDYVHNSLLINGRKFDFRFYMLIASTNPLIVYYYDGLLRVSLEEYDVHSDQKNVLLTNLAFNKDIYKDAKEGVEYKGMNETEILYAQQWNFQRLQAYLLEKGLITDPNWLENYLRPEFKKALIHLLRAVQGKFLENSSVYELYGVDFIIDEDMKIWFLEANAGPSWDGDYPEDIENLIVQVLKDHFEIVYGLLKSKMKRIIHFVNKILINKEYEIIESEEELVITNLEEKRKEFEMITRNYFEKEYEPSPTNGFSKFIDENLEGVDRYFGLISEDCL